MNLQTSDGSGFQTLAQKSWYATARVIANSYKQVLFLLFLAWAYMNLR